MGQINVIIDNKSVAANTDMTILEAAKKINVNIPTLCYHPDQNLKANCRICVVEVKGSKKLSPACATYLRDGMEIVTNSKKVRDMQKGILELMLANHNQDCLKCLRNGNCELQELCRRFGVTKTDLNESPEMLPLDNTNPSLVRDQSKCIKCNRCVEVCQKTQAVNALTYSGRSTHYNIAPAYGAPLEETQCVYCGQCSAVCPVGAIVEKDDTQRVWDAIDDPSKHVIVQVAPAVRVALGDMFGLKKGSIVTGKMISALRMLGFEKIFDTNFVADLTIMEEGSELIERVKNGGVLPMITSCSPGWVNFIEHKHDNLLPHLSTCKSPQQMFGALSKSYYPQVRECKPEDIFSVSIMPCTAKKFECQRSEMKTNGVQEVDVVLTTRELTRMIETAGIDFVNLDEDKFDDPFGIGSGAGAIFGATGGVMEAAVRTAYELMTDKPLDNINLKAVRGLEGIKEAVLDVDGTELKIAVANGLANAEILIKQIEEGTSSYHFIEIMACPGGCIGGGGQPIKSTMEVKAQRMDAIYDIDNSLQIRKSHENPDILKLYEVFLEKPLGHKSHELLHTHYSARPKCYDFRGLE